MLPLWFWRRKRESQLNLFLVAHTCVSVWFAFLRIFIDTAFSVICCQLKNCWCLPGLWQWSNQVDEYEICYFLFLNLGTNMLFLVAALKYDPTNVRYLWERSSLYEQLGEHKNAMDGYRRILNLLSPSDGERFMQLARDMAK